MARFFSSFAIALSLFLNANLTFGQFPEELQACFDSGQCKVTAIGHVSPEIGYYFYTDESGDEFFLMRYTIGGDSIHSVSFDKFSDNEDLTGVVWVSGRTAYPGSGFFKFYMEDVAPDYVIPSSNFDLETFDVTMSEMALLAGEGWFSINVDDPFPMGNMDSNGVLICLSETCEIGGTFNLLGMRFVEQNGENVLELNFAEKRSHLYDHYASFDGNEYKGPMFNFQSFELGGCQMSGSGIFGDVNGDNQVDLLDVAPFVEVLSTGCYQFEADVFFDGQVNLLDVSPFVDLLTQ